MGQFLRGIMGPLTGEEHGFCGDGFAEGLHEFHPLALAAFNGDGNDDDDDLDPLPNPPAFGDANTQAAVNRYFEDLNRTHQRNNRKQQTYRKRLEAAESKVAKLPPEGAIVLTADEGKVWESYKGLGAPADIQTKLGERDTLSQQVEESRKRDHLGAVAQAAGYKPTVLAKFFGDREYEVRDVSETKDGKTVTTKVAFIKDGNAFTPLTDYAKTAWADELPALVATGNSTGGGTGHTTALPPQHSGGSNGGGGTLDQFLANREKAVTEVKSPFAQ